MLFLTFSFFLVGRYRWYRQTPQYGGLLLSVHNGGRYRLVGGTLIVKSVQPEDQGRYACVVNNSVGVAESRTTFLVREKLQVRIEPSIIVVDAGKEVMLTCTWNGSPR